jgi:hypothetical protein
VTTEISSNYKQNADEIAFLFLLYNIFAGIAVFLYIKNNILTINIIHENILLLHEESLKRMRPDLKGICLGVFQKVVLFLTASDVVSDRQWCCFGQTVVRFWTDSGDVLERRLYRYGQTAASFVLDRQLCRFGQTIVSFWTDSGVVLDKKCCRFGQEMLSDVLYRQWCRFGQEVVRFLKVGWLGKCNGVVFSENVRFRPGVVLDSGVVFQKKWYGFGKEVLWLWT